MMTHLCHPEHHSARARHNFLREGICPGQTPRHDQTSGTYHGAGTRTSKQHSRVPPAASLSTPERRP